MATEVAILPSVNKNLSNMLDCNAYGFVVYGSRDNVYVFDFRSIPPIILDDKVIRTAHRGRVISVSCCKLKDNELVAAISDKPSLKILNLKTASTVAELTVKEVSRIVEWLYESSSTVVFSDMYGTVAKWNFKSNKLQRLKTSSDVAVSAIASNPLSPDLIAVGHGSGAISVLNVATQALLHTLRIHHMEVTSLSWSPLLSDVLLSTSMDQSARVWKMGEEKPIKTYYFPTSRVKPDDKRNFRVCSTFHPVNPDVIICSNVRGNLGTVTFKGKEIPKFSPFLVEDADTNFKSIGKLLPYCVDIDGKKKLFLLTSDHIKLSLWDMTEAKLVQSYYHQYGFLYDIKNSPINPNLLSICSGDGIFRMWNLASANTKLDITSILLHHKAKIMTAAWHPTEESIVAYGTDEGEVGIIDVFQKKIQYSFETHHSRAVYGLAWAPYFKDSENDSSADSKEFFLYSCGGNTIRINRLNKPKEKALEFERLVEYPPDIEIFNEFSDVVWKSDYTCVVAGNYKGFVDLFNNKFVFICRFAIQTKNVESASWHPLCTYASPGGSPFNTWIAVTGTDEFIHILDTNDVVPGSTICRYSKVLVGHKKKVCSVSWSQHIDGRLASGSKDGTVQVWNVATASLIANYAYHKDVVHAVLWSVIDPDIIFSGGMDLCLRVWKISDQRESAPPAVSVVTKHRKPLKKVRERKVSPVNDFTNDAVESRSDAHEGDHSKEYAEEGTSDMPVADRSSENNFRTKSRDGSKAFEKKVVNIFPHLNYRYYNKEEYFEQVFKLTDLLSECCNSYDSVPTMFNKIDSDDIDKLGIFADQLSALKMIENQAKHFRELKFKEHASFLDIMAYNIEPLLKDAAEKGQLSDFLIAAAPSVSHSFWVEMCEKFAMQLVEDNQYLKASVYLSMCGKLYEAINGLTEKGKVVEALALAKARLPETDPVIESLLYKNARNFSHHKLIEAEALCYLAMKQPALAAKALYCAPESKYIWAATYICKKFNLNDDMEVYAYCCIERSLSQNDWPTFYKLAEQVENVKVYTIVVRVHELIHSHKKVLKKDEFVANDIFGKSESKILVWSGKTSEDLNLPFLTHVYNCIISEGILPTDKDSLQAIHEALCSMESKRKKSEVAAQAHIYVAICVAQLIVTSALGELDLAVRYFNKIFVKSYHIVFLPKVICWMFLPIDVYWCNDEEKFLASVRSPESEIASFAVNLNNLYQSLCSKFPILDLSSLKPNTIRENVTSNIETAVQIVGDILSEKKTEDSLLLFFMASYVNELRRLVKKGWRFKCYVTASEIIKIKDEVKAPNEIESCTIQEVSECVKDKLQELIQLALKEAEEKAELISEANNKIEENGCNSSVAALEHSVSPIFEKKGSLSIKANGDSLNEINEKLSNGKLCEDDVQNKCGLDNKDTIENGVNEKDLDDRSSCDEINGKGISSNAYADQDASQNSDNYNDEGVKENIIENQFSASSQGSSCHEACWNDINLFYVLTKSFASELCKDEYALIHYLIKRVDNIDTTMSHLTRNLSTKSSAVTSKMSGKISSVNGQSCKSENIKDQESIGDSSVQNKVDGDVCNTNIIQEHLEHNGVTISVDNSINRLNSDIESVKPEETNLLISKDNSEVLQKKLDSVSHLEAVKIDDQSKNIMNGESGDLSDSSPDKLNSVLNSNTTSAEKSDENNESSSESCIECASLPSEVNDLKEVQDINASNPETSEMNLLEEGVTVKSLQAEHMRISEFIKFLKSKEFCYPNPFDAASNVIGICCDAFHKNPCEVVQEKFHSLAHEVIHWSAKYCAMDNTLSVCQICSANLSL